MSGAQYHSIQLDSLIIDTALDFDLHSKITRGGYVLFRGRDQEFGLQHRDRLISNGIHTLYISQEDQSQYGRYIEKNIGMLAKDPTVSFLKRPNCSTRFQKGFYWMLSLTRVRPTLSSA